MPEEYLGLVDDAAVFPPRELPLAEAVAEHRQHRAAPYAGMVGPFVVSDVRLPELGALTEGDAQPLAVTVVVSGGAGALEPAARWAGGSASLQLRSLEVALRDLDDLPGSARRVVTAATALDVPVRVEPPTVQSGGAGWLSALDEVAAAGLHLKFRTGGVTADLVPSPEQLACCIDAALDREVSFKCTAGLHEAVRRALPGGGTTHGFLNVLLATRAALDGDDVTAVLAEPAREVLMERLRAVGSEALVRTRRWFTSFGCCDVTDPVNDLRNLGLFPQ
ncbi:MAG: hypothetical protein QOK15_1664 [Nocardioidaceae bacterium]|nr:hypothetical protein [Nocardioidaceae bacterium]